MRHVGTVFGLAPNADAFDSFGLPFPDLSVTISQIQVGPAGLFQILICHVVGIVLTWHQMLLFSAPLGLPFPDLAVTISQIQVRGEACYGSILATAVSPSRLLQLLQV